MSCEDWYADYGDMEDARMNGPRDMRVEGNSVIGEPRGIICRTASAASSHTCSDISAREEFTVILSTGPLLHADAIIVLCGEDAEPRIAVAAELMRGGGAPLMVLTGGVHDGDRWLSAEACFAKLIAKGVAFERMWMDPGPANTREQAVNTVGLAIEREWTRLLLVASPYHAPRAFLTFVHALREREAHERVRIVNAPASQTRWFEAPAGMTETRAELLAIETAKIDTYQVKGDVASYADGLAYLKFWETK